MMTSTTFILDPPLGRYSSGTCVNWLARVPHPAAPSVATPAVPAPATFRKSRRVRVRLVNVRLPTADGASSRASFVLAFVPGAGTPAFSMAPRLGAGPPEIVTCRVALRRRSHPRSRPAASCTKVGPVLEATGGRTCATRTWRGDRFELARNRRLRVSGDGPDPVPDGGGRPRHPRRRQPHRRRPRRPRYRRRLRREIPG